MANTTKKVKKAVVTLDKTVKTETTLQLVSPKGFEFQVDLDYDDEVSGVMVRDTGNYKSKSVLERMCKYAMQDLITQPEDEYQDMLQLLAKLREETANLQDEHEVEE